MEKLVLENEYKIVVLLFGATYAAPNKRTTILYWFRFLSTVLSPTENSKIQGFFKADLIFKDFSSKPSKFKYFLSLWEPCIHSAPLRGDLKLFERLNQAHPKKHVELPSTQRCNERMMWYCKFGNFHEGFIFVKLPIFEVSWK